MSQYRRGLRVVLIVKKPIKMCFVENKRLTETSLAVINPHASVDKVSTVVQKVIGSSSDAGMFFLFLCFVLKRLQPAMIAKVSQINTSIRHMVFERSFLHKPFSRITAALN